MRYEPLCGASTAVDDAPERARRMGIEVAELHLHEMVQAGFPQVARRMEGTCVGAEQREEVQHETRNGQEEREPPVKRQVLCCRPVRGDRDEVARDEPDADIGTEREQHSHC